MTTIITQKSAHLFLFQNRCFFDSFFRTDVSLGSFQTIQTPYSWPAQSMEIADYEKECIQDPHIHHCSKWRKAAYKQTADCSMPVHCPLKLQCWAWRVIQINYHLHYTVHELNWLHCDNLLEGIFLFINVIV